MAAAEKTSPAPLLVTGSLFVVGEGREVLGLAEPDLVWRALNEERNAPHGTLHRPERPPQTPEGVPAIQ